MSNLDFQWIFPSAPPNITSSLNFTAQNATANTGVFGKLPVYVNDAIRLEWNDSTSSDQTANVQYECGINPNGSRSHIGVGQSFNGRPPFTWTFEFLSSPSPSPTPSPSANSSLVPSSGLAEDICVFLHYNHTLGTFYLTTAFSILNTTRQGQPYLYTIDTPFGSPKTAPSVQTADSKHGHSNLAAILGSVLGCLALLVIVIAFVFWRRRSTRRNGVGKGLVRDDTQVELERVGSMATTMPPAYEERMREGDTEESGNAAGGERRAKSAAKSAAKPVDFENGLKKS
ncbi:uncharacterized protein BDR25DRAFT_342253 [Lindgomyces ingoldianus]|uniref:Uncharacterized protein n=1 Tax=Lindgomyces ingoldianus TaxID=673940 RepID=A0ACB6QWU6_9PLEO|nr:uncharacterized protein BDR25DRAFT_342253 [Lindgomyces ingoldianus]KAF2471498.1 hypothetical protein BDR25DRAFT_342253 [Lindgomyces ingoldianus]